MFDDLIPSAEEVKRALLPSIGSVMREEILAHVYLPEGQNPAPTETGKLGVIYARIQQQAELAIVEFSWNWLPFLVDNAAIWIRRNDSGNYELTRIEATENQTAVAGVPVFNPFGAQHDHESATGGGTLSTDALQAGTLPVARGGTGATTLTANNVILGNGTSTVNFVAPSTSGNVLMSNGTTWTSAANTASFVPTSLSGFTSTQVGVPYVLNDTTFGFARHNLSSAVDPATSNNTSEGYVVGVSLWNNTTAHRVFFLESQAGSIALWRQIYPTPWDLPSGPIGISGAQDVYADDLNVNGAATFSGSLALPTSAVANSGQVAYVSSHYNARQRSINGSFPFAFDTIKRRTTAITTTTETTVHATTFTMPASGWNTGTTIMCEFYGRISNSSGGSSNLTIAAKVGGTAIISSGALAIANGASLLHYRFRFTLECLTTGAGGTQSAMVDGYIQGVFGSTFVIQSAALNTTVTRTIEYTATWSAAGGGGVTFSVDGFRMWQEN